MVLRIIDYLNRVSGHKYRPTPNTVKAIKQRLKDTGYSFKEVCRMLKYKWLAWRNSDMEIYFRPSTLFRPSHFGEYVEEALFDFRKKAKWRREIWKDRIEDEEDVQQPVTPEDIRKIKEKIRETIRNLS